MGKSIVIATPEWSFECPMCGRHSLSRIKIENGKIEGGVWETRCSDCEEQFFVEPRQSHELGAVKL